MFIPLTCLTRVSVLLLFADCCSVVKTLSIIPHSYRFFSSQCIVWSSTHLQNNPYSTCKGHQLLMNYVLGGYRRTSREYIDIASSVWTEHKIPLASSTLLVYQSSVVRHSIWTCSVFRRMFWKPCSFSGTLAACLAFCHAYCACVWVCMCNGLHL